MPFLSLCMIARDEATSIGDAINSCRGVADEIVVVDTGSTDATADIARSLGAKVIPAKWEDSFSAPRNLGFEHATGEWLIVLDCDEKLRPESGQVVLDICRKSAAPAYSVNWIVHTATGASSTRALRLARRDEGIRLRGRVHEKPDRPLSHLAHCDVCIDHYAQLLPRWDAQLLPRWEKKLALYDRLLHMDLADRPDDNYLLINLLHNYWGTRDSRWREYLPRAVATLDRESPGPPHALVALLLEIIFRLPVGSEPDGLSKQQADQLIERWLPGSIPLSAARARWHAENNRDEQAIRIATRAIGDWNCKSYQTDVAFNPGPIIGNLLLVLGVALARQGRISEGMECFEKAQAFPEVAQSAGLNLQLLGNSK